MAGNPSYVHLRSVVEEALRTVSMENVGEYGYGGEIFDRYVVSDEGVQEVMDAIWPEIEGIIAAGNLLALDHTRTPASIDAWYMLTNQWDKT